MVGAQVETSTAARLGGMSLESTDATFALAGNNTNCCPATWIAKNYLLRQANWSLQQCKAECVHRGAHCLYISHVQSPPLCYLCATCDVPRSGRRLPAKERDVVSWKRLGRLAEMATTNWSYGTARVGAAAYVPTARLSLRRSRNCAFNFERCRGRLRVYVYASEPHVDLHDYMYYHIRTFIDRSVLQALFVDDPAEACLFICPIGFYYNERFLHRLPYWNGGENHLIWDPWDWDRIDRRSIGKAMLATTNSVWNGTFDQRCDISMPIGAQVVYPALRPQTSRKYLATFRGRIHGARFYGGGRQRMQRWHSDTHRVIISDSAAKKPTAVAPRGKLVSSDEDANSKVQQVDNVYLDLLNSTFSLIPDGNGPATYRDHRGGRARVRSICGPVRGLTPYAGAG